MSPSATKRVLSRPGSISPAFTHFSGALMELDEYRPSIADQVRVGYFSQDRSSQTEVSEIAQLKEMTEVLQNLVRDIENLKRSLHYAKHVLQADYENKLQERALDLYCRVNDRILELEKHHEERVNVIRRSYRQQLADAITQIASQHQEYYAKKSKQDKAMFSEKLKKVQDDDDVKKKAQHQQDSIIEMMKMQMRDAQDRADKQLDDALNRPQSASSVATNPEVYELREEVEKLENKLDDMMNQLEDRENENRRLVTDIDDLNEQLNGERRQGQQLKKELSDALLAAEHERNNFRAEHKLSSYQDSSNKFDDVKTVDQTTMFFLLQKQKAQLQREMDSKIQETKNNLIAASRKQVEDLQKAHDQKIKDQKILDEKRKLMESQQTKSTTVTGRALTDQIPAYEPGFMASRLRRMEKPELSESEKDELLRKLQKLEKKQKAEILRLQKELDRVNRTWEMKVTILQQTLHALKDESFLRTSLQRQAARLQQAAVVYASDGPAVIAVSDRKGFTERTFRTLERPGRTKETVPYSKADRPAADSPFSEDRPTPAPPVEGEPPFTSMKRSA
ncbi:hypothetical protein OS493_007804 [Desmophyllum pertusum]|uniref:DUF4709 domain-containing protein n=1 Tax=Desmophyllum pertusum TaxID=174260 RepID=A0A9W9YRZ9_9CNID|nr:hypothetical protein OS493_007804 [Desmophyllum pertusum]